MKNFFRNCWPLLLWAVLAVVVFAPAFGKYVVFPSPDGPPGPLCEPLNMVNELLSGTAAVAPHDLLRLVIPPYYYSDATYLFDTILIALGFAYFIAGLGIPRLAAAFSGGALAFMGYSLTLFSAGHRGFFFMTAYVVFLFAFLVRAIDGRGAAHYALAAFCAAWALRYQPDFAAIYLVLAAVYALCRAAWRIRDAGAADRKARLRKTAVGFGIALATFAVVAAPTVHNAFTTLIKGRMEQIAQTAPAPSGGNAQTPDAATPDAARETPDAKWIFATNWSLPPEETLEFIAPAYKGRWNGDAKAPYWGRLGRTWKWEETHQGFMNFRQHVVYLGAIPLALALYAVIMLIAPAWRRSETIRPFRFDAAFWAVVWVVALLLAYGRYAPFYRLVYSLPYVSLLRAPVKFIRLVEFATAALAAIGLAAMLDARRDARPLRLFARVSAGLAAATALVALYARIAPMSFCSELLALNAQNLVEPMARHAAGALLHGVVGFGIVAAVTALLARDRPHPRATEAAVAVLALALAVDVALVARPFAFTADLSREYTDANPVTAAVAGMRPVPLAGCLIQDRQVVEALRGNFAKHSYGLYPRPADDHGQFLAEPLGGGIPRLIELNGCGYAAVAAQEARLLPRDRFEPVCFLTPSRSPDLFAKTLKPVTNGYLLVKVRNPQPYARLYSRWGVAPEGRLFAEVARAMGPAGSDTLAVEAADLPPPPGGAPGTAEVVSAQNIDGALRTVIRTQAASGQVLALLRGFAAGNVVTLDGKPARAFRAGYGGTGVYVPAGEHTVTICNWGRNIPAFILSATAFLAFAALLAATLLRDAGAAKGRAP